MFEPSGVQKSKYKVVEVDNGLYSVLDAYEGEIEYFQGRPAASSVLKKREKSQISDNRLANQFLYIGP